MISQSPTDPPFAPESLPEAFKPSQRSSTHWHELDLFRGLAAAFMVINHVATDSPNYATVPWLSISERIGGFAPVLFYFATGLGYGVQSTKREGRRGLGFLLKVAILLAADSDFFVFIGSSMLILEILRRLPRGEWVAAGLAVAAIASRFVVGALLRSTLESHWWGGWVGDFLGTGSRLGYAPGPWLAYPMFGYLLGRHAASRREALEKNRWLPGLLLGFAIPFALGSVALVARGGDLQRYGSMNAAYFLASIAMLALVLSACFALTRIAALRRLVGLISLSGLRSFAVVPLHYLLLGLVVAWLGIPVDAKGYLIILALVLPISFVGSAYFVRIASLLDRSANRTFLWLIGLAAVVAFHAAFRGATAGLAEIAIRSTYQLLLCVLLTLRVGLAPAPRDPSAR